MSRDALAEAKPQAAAGVWRWVLRATACGLVPSMLGTACSGRMIGEKSEEANDAVAGGRAAVSSAGGRAAVSGAGGRASVGGSGDGGVGLRDASVGGEPGVGLECLDESCQPTVARLDARWPESDRPAGTALEVCCTDGLGLCGARHSPEHGCFTVEVLERLVDGFVASHQDPLGDASRPWDGAAPRCPVDTPGAQVSGEACHLCLLEGAPCTSMLSIPAPTAADCAGWLSNDPNMRCLWYPDGYDANLVWGAQFWCLSNPGRVVCGGGL